MFTLNTIKGPKYSNGSATNIITELELPSLEVSLPVYSLSTKININEEYEMTMNYTQLPNAPVTPPENLYYSIAIIYQKETVATF